MGGRHALARAGDSRKAGADTSICYATYSFKIIKNTFNTYIMFKQFCKQNKAKLRCTSHLFSWNSTINLAVICEPDSTVRSNQYHLAS